MGKREREKTAGNQHFLLLPLCFLFDQREKSSVQQHLICCLQMLWIWSCPKMSFGIELTMTIKILKTLWENILPHNRTFENIAGRYFTLQSDVLTHYHTMMKF